MKPKLSLVEISPAPRRAKSVEAELSALLRGELRLIRKLAEVRGQIAPLKRIYMEEHQVFGLHNDALRRDMAFRRIR